MFNGYVTMLARAGLGTCVVFAAVSVALWYVLTQASEPIGGDLSALPDGWAALPGWLLVWSTGSVYSALVLFRYLPSAATGTRAVVLVVAGALSYWIGVNFSIHVQPTGSYVADTAIAGTFTAAGLGYLVIRLGTLRFSPVSFVALCAAGALGGALISVGAVNELTGDFVGGHAAWQILTCIALYFAPRSATPTTRRG